jgi:hypothetical protein
MFKSIDTSQNGGSDAITFGNNKKGKVKGLGKIAISNNMSISNVFTKSTVGSMKWLDAWRFVVHQTRQHASVASDQAAVRRPMAPFV